MPHSICLGGLERAAAVALVLALGCTSSRSGAASALSDPHAQPALEPGRSATWTRVEGPLFSPRGPGASEVVQGKLADCTLLAPIAEIARVHPEHWTQSIAARGAGVYAVTLYDGQPLRAVQVLVDDEMPTEGGALLYARPGPSGAIWPLLVEKAVAKLRGGYARLRGHTDRAMANLMGWGTAHQDSKLAAAELARVLESAEHQREVVLTSTPSSARFDALAPELRDGLVPAHEYSVLKVVDERDGPAVLVRNPWGSHVPRLARDAGEGFFWMKLADFTRVFDGLTVSGPNVSR